MSVIEMIFGIASLLSLLFAVYIYFKSKEWIYPLIEKLRASRNNFIEVGRKANRIVKIAELKNRSSDEKVMMMRQVARTIEEGVDRHMHTIDDGKDWEELNVKEIYSNLK
jgi:hypothetical protein